MEHKNLIEKMSELEHEQWIHWTRHFTNNLNYENIKRWKKQTKIKYNDLSEKDKDKDRKFAKKVSELLIKDFLEKLKLKIIDFSKTHPNVHIDNFIKRELNF